MTPMRKAPPGIWILAFFNNVRSDQARNLHRQSISDEIKYNENRFLTKISPLARNPKVIRCARPEIYRLE